ncbi:MAG: serine--tRNA ligase [Tissierellia bacterium]|nr:serine--tRNA ligase [Tissierellia bacterium]
MLDIRRIRSDAEGVKSSLLNRGGNYPIDTIVKLDESRRSILPELEEMRSHHIKCSMDIPKLKAEKLDTTALIQEMKTLSETIRTLEKRVVDIDLELKRHLSNIPNIPDDDVPIGVDENDNVVIRTFMEPTKFPYVPKPHWDIGVDLNILDWDRARKITGPRFSLFKGQGAKLERALINFMLDTHVSSNGYQECSTPFVVNSSSMVGTGQLPKFEEGMFKLENTDYFLVPTAEVPLTNMLAEEIVDEHSLPIKLTAYSPCFRREVGATGRDTRGLIRNHQFNKVELVNFVHPADSSTALEAITNDAEQILQALKLPYRVVELCTGDLGFSAAKTYDIEVWMPCYNRYVEISSCSNFKDFQARRTNIKFRSKDSKKVNFLHTLNASGLAVGRTFAAILENFQQSDGLVLIPEVLRPYFGGQSHIKKCKDIVDS